MSSHPVLGLSAKSFHYASPSYVAATGSQFWSHIYYGRTVHISFSCTDSYVELLHYPRQNLKIPVYVRIFDKEAHLGWCDVTAKHQFTHSLLKNTATITSTHTNGTKTKHDTYIASEERYYRGFLVLLLVTRIPFLFTHTQLVD